MSTLSIDTPDAIILAHQRSGTHLLQSCLESHPKIRGRGEFVLHYRRRLQRRAGETAPTDLDRIWRNVPGVINTGIVMYSQVPTYESLCGKLGNQRIVHLIRDPHNVAQSVAQMEADRVLRGAAFRAHFRVDEELPSPAPTLGDDIAVIEAKVTALQAQFIKRLEGHPKCLRISYEAITGNREVRELPRELTAHILEFFGLEYHPLRTDLRKTSLSYCPQSCATLESRLPSPERIA
jgi:hypothetical protein